MTLNEIKGVSQDGEVLGHGAVALFLLRLSSSLHRSGHDASPPGLNALHRLLLLSLLLSMQLLVHLHLVIIIDNGSHSLVFIVLVLSLPLDGLAFLPEASQFFLEARRLVEIMLLPFAGLGFQSIVLLQ